MSLGEPCLAMLEAEFERVVDGHAEPARNTRAAFRAGRSSASHSWQSETPRERERRFRTLLDALPAAVYTTDAAGRITFYNQAAVDL